MGAALCFPLEVAVLLGNHWAQAAVSVPSDQPGDVVLKLRDRIVVDERELLASPRMRWCSSLEHGPFCQRFGDPGSSREPLGLVDGVLSRQMCGLYPEAFHWNSRREQNIALKMSELLIRTRGEKALSERTRSRCFQLQLSRLLPSHNFLPESFGEGFPVDVAPRWHGIWQVIGKCPSPASATTDIFFGESQPGRGPCLRLHGLGETNSASVRFQRPLVLPQLIIGIDTLDFWSEGSFVCGKLKGFEKWCRDLVDVAADARASKTHGAGDGTFYRDIGDSFQMIDEVAFHSVPQEGLLISSMAASADGGQKTGETELVLLLYRTPSLGEKLPIAPPGPFNAQLQSISANAAVWNANEILAHGLSLSGYSSGVEQLSSRSKYLAKEHSKRMEETLARQKSEFREHLEHLKKIGQLTEEEVEQIWKSEGMMEPESDVEQVQEESTPPESKASDFDGTFQEELADALSELLQTFGVEGTEEELQRSDGKFRDVQMGKVMDEAEPQELIAEMASSLLKLKQADEPESDFTLPGRSGSKETSEEAAYTLDP